VPKADLAPAIALGSTTFNGARIIGPAIAGLMILAWGTGPVIGLAAASYLLFAVVLMILPVTEPPHPNKSLNVIADLIDGFAYVKKERGIAFLLAMVGTLGMFVRPSIELLPGYAAQVFGRGPDGLALLLSAIGVGAMIAGFWVAQRGRTQGLTSLVALATTGMGAMWILSTFFQHIWVAAVFLAASGFFMLCANVCSQTLIQNSVDPRMRARVIGIFIVISWGFPALGAIALGWLATQIGIREAFICASAFAVLLYLWSRREASRVAPKLEASS
jgi:predicted MFS family arabinose efflux permease